MNCRLKEYYLEIKKTLQIFYYVASVTGARFDEFSFTEFFLIF